MMSVMRARRMWPFLLALPMLAMMAVLVYWQPSQVAAQSDGQLPAPTVLLTAQSACDPENPRTYLAVQHGAVENADGYEYRVKWGRGGGLGDNWQKVSDTRTPGRPWPLSLERHVKPGETYVVQVRAVDENGDHGPFGVARYSYDVGDFPAPSRLEVAYATDGEGNKDYTRARVSWRGDERSGGWYSLQKRVVGKRWQSGGWKQASRTGDECNRRLLCLLQTRVTLGRPV